jgi:hypothetical protein
MPRVPGEAPINIWFSKLANGNINTGGTKLPRALMHPVMVIATPFAPDFTLPQLLTQLLEPKLQGD